MTVTGRRSREYLRGLLSARANLEGPIVKDRSSFNVSVRRTWLILITGTALAIVNKNE